MLYNVGRFVAERVLTLPLQKVGKGSLNLSFSISISVRTFRRVCLSGSPNRPGTGFSRPGALRRSLAGKEASPILPRQEAAATKYTHTTRSTRGMRIVNDI